MASIDLHMRFKYPSGLAWSPDSVRLAYQVSGPLGSEVYTFSRSEPECCLVDAAVAPFRLYKDLPDLRWADDRRLVYFAGGQYRQAEPSASQPALYADTALLGDLPQLSPDLAQVCFIRDGDLWLAPAGGAVGAARQLTRREGLLDSDGQLFSRLVQRPQWSPDGRWIAYLSPMGSGLKIRIASTQGERPINLAPRQDIWGFQILNWSPDSQKLAVSRLSTDFQRKELLVYSLTGQGQAGGEEQIIWADQDEKWVDHNIHPGFDAAWACDSRRLAFLSNRGGWRHLYTADLGSASGSDSLKLSVSVHQVTRGAYDCYWCGWSPDGSQLAYVSSQAHLQERRLYLTRLDGSPDRLLTPEPGTCLGGWYLRQMNLAWSPDSRQIAHVYSGPDQMPALCITPAARGESPVVVYSSQPEGMDRAQIMHLEPVQFEGPDGSPVYAALAAAPGFSRQAKHPALVFAYGAWDQEAQLGWDFGPKNLIFNYLAAQGFVILLVDPRGSDGYGRGHAQRQFHEGGRLQADDLAAAARYLAGQEYIDPQRIALFGYSYGGYLVLQTMVHAPGVFAAGISMAPVSEWASYAGYSTYTRLRFGSPDEEPNPLFARSPVYQAHKIEGELLILHGTQDFNVPILSSEIMVSALMRAGKKFEFMAYPGEGHVWVQPATIRDSILRMERFLNNYST